jgi:hypothetical protein
MSIRSWIQDRAHALEVTYHLTERLFRRLDPLFERVGYRRIERIILPPEKLSKELVFDCRMCGQCILHSTGMTCPMTCPKLLRNGPCGGVRPEGYCEVYPERRCVWVQAYERSRKMPRHGEGIQDLQPMVDWRLEDTSAWINLITGADRQPSKRF